MMLELNTFLKDWIIEFEYVPSAAKYPLLPKMPDFVKDNFLRYLELIMICKTPPITN